MADISIRIIKTNVEPGFPQVTSDDISWLFPDQVPIFTDYLQYKNMIFWPSWEFTWVTQLEKNIVAIIWHKIIMICHFYVPYQLNYGLIFKYPKYIEIRFLIFLYFFLAIARLGNRIMTLADSPSLEWGLHTDNNSIFLTFSWLLVNFKIPWPIWKFTDFLLTF